MATIPRLSHSISIADEDHIRIYYDDLTEEVVSLSPATDPKLYWALSDASSIDLLKATQDALDSAASVTASSVSIGSTQRVIIAINSVKTVVKLEFMTSYFRPFQFGVCD